MIVVVEGPSAAGKTTWCRRHAPQFLPEPGQSPEERILRYQIDRWRRAARRADRGELVVLDGDPFKLYYGWASWRLGAQSTTTWDALVATARRHFAAGDLGLADLVLYGDPGEEELRRRRAQDATRSRRNFEVNTRMRPYFQRWYRAVGLLDPLRVVWEHPSEGLAPTLLDVGPRGSRSDPALLDRLLALLPAGP